ncbi:MAG TPA: helix-turn-helix transcriptional regulator [Pseudolysinimonas sp.]|jgi:transcriptional regulator with XRE-family HTH domain|nr:helix-turn-helix transcriptional regulator [Pseudolysinimonas sp.]
MENRPVLQQAESAARLGQLIQQTRQSKHLSLRRLGSMCGIPYRTIDRIERGEIARPRPDVLTALARALMIPTADVYAIVHYSAPHDLPSFAPYLRARYSDLPSSAIEELVDYFDSLAHREGVRLDGPANHEDEKR